MTQPSTNSMRIEVSMDDQILSVIENEKCLRRYTISTGEKGMGFVEGSFRTPTGRFRISEKIGDGEPIRTRFVARIPYGVWDESKQCEEDLILTRILRIDGLDPENENTLQRNIYVHGTNREDRIGTLASHGCIRLRNHDMLELYDMIPVGTEIQIHPLTKPRGKLMFIDCDSTLSSIEGIDELARLCDPETFHQVEQLTNAAMNGEVPLNQVFKQRIDIIRPNRKMADEVAMQYIQTIVPGAAELVHYAVATGWLPVILSGGFEPLIRPLAKHLGIRHVEAVPLFFDENGDYAGYGEDYPTTRNLGKNQVIREWTNALLPERVVMIGDGISDLETTDDVDQMIGYGGVVTRDKVKAGADLWVETFENNKTLISVFS